MIGFIFALAGAALFVAFVVAIVGSWAILPLLVGLGLCCALVGSES